MAQRLAHVSRSHAWIATVVSVYANRHCHARHRTCRGCCGERSIRAIGVGGAELSQGWLQEKGDSDAGIGLRQVCRRRQHAVGWTLRKIKGSSSEERPHMIVMQSKPLTTQAQRCRKTFFGDRQSNGVNCHRKSVAI